ncbi:MAG: hypothetical protein GYA21_11375 [Myxococcales bacterium]|nr:hypothetical protein [Myxococcales bacterium]
MTETKATRAIAERLRAVEPGTPRHEVLSAARKFKTSWVELGGKLWEVRKKEMYRDWGFDSFDLYCRDEIRIKPATAQKLTMSYGFLKSEEPQLLKRDGVVEPLPAPETVDLLRRAREKAKLPDEQYRRFREMAFDDEAPPSELRREMKPFLSVVSPSEPRTSKQMFRKLVAQAQRLADTLASVAGVPRVIVERALALVDDLRTLAG